ncbi:hypothetical protein BJX65DRAFT_222906 [Aspergillus insuetus]
MTGSGFRQTDQRLRISWPQPKKRHEDGCLRYRSIRRSNAISVLIRWKFSRLGVQDEPVAKDDRQRREQGQTPGARLVSSETNGAIFYFLFPYLPSICAVPNFLFDRAWMLLIY